LLVLGQMAVFFDGTLEEEVEDVVIGLRPLARVVPGVQFLHEGLVEQK